MHAHTHTCAGRSVGASLGSCLMLCCSSCSGPLAAPPSRAAWTWLPRIRCSPHRAPACPAGTPSRRRTRRSYPEEISEIKGAVGREAVHVAAWENSTWHFTPISNLHMCLSNVTSGWFIGSVRLWDGFHNLLLRKCEQAICAENEPFHRFRCCLQPSNKK